MITDMRVLIVGYGKMGKEVESILLQRNHVVSGKVDPAGGPGVETELSIPVLKSADVAIEFSLPSGVEQNARLYAESGIHVVLGTTGWETMRPAVEKTVRASGIGFIHGSNFSVGAHLFFALVEKAAALVESIPDYDIMLWELHHRMKKDSPSGTALTAAHRILGANSRKTTIQTEKLDRQIRPEELHVASVRGGTVPGTHSMLLDSTADTIEITHTARSRGGFALGAVMAAEWISTRKGFFSVDDFIRDILNGNGA